ncbi:MAG: lamin tail domain-containing protein [Pirellulales bacterium]
MRNPLTVVAGTRRAKPAKPKRNPVLEQLESRLVLSADPFISEFLAVNNTGLADQNGDYSDWIEIHNPTTADINLDSWYLTDDAAALAKWRFPAVNLPVGGYLTVFASGKNRAVAGSELHTNFRLDGLGEYLALVRPDGTTVVSQYNPSFPEQVADVSYGIVRDSADTTLLAAGAPVKAFVPPNDSLALTWTNSDFLAGPEWTGATTGVGFDTQTGYEALIGTDVELSMYNRSTSIYMRVPFQVSDPTWFDFLTLKMKYDDGFVAYLNGQLIASRYAPSPALWNSKANASHPDSAALVYDVIDVSKYRGALQPGTNVLAIQGLNVTANDTDFLIVPELVGGHAIGSRERYFATPTPGSTNRGDIAGVVGALAFSQTRGFFDAPFALSLSTSTEGAVIRYTTDGTVPTETNGMVYTAPLSITKTTTLRAAAFKGDFKPASVETQTYIFLDDVIKQTKPADSRYPTVWSGYAADYDMDPSVVNVSPYNKTIKNDLKAVPTLSIVMNPDDMFGTSGIYTNSMQEGVAWERAASTELIYGDGTPGFQINNGIRIQGGWGRRPDQSGKHSFRLFFKNEYGPTKLTFPFFGSSAVGEFDSIMLRAGFNYAWASNGGGNAQYIQDQFARDTLLAMGNFQAHGNYVHLYINGLYWGLYNSCERPDASFAESYLGGQKEDYDVLVTGQVTDGNRTAWNTMINLAGAGLATQAQYNAIQQYLDVPNLIDYLIVNIYGGNWDWPHNNWYASRSRTPDGRFRFYSWDAEGTLHDINANNSNVNAADSPGALYAALRGNAEFRLLFADRLQKYFFNNGLLTPQVAIDRFMARAREIDRAVVGESARWGDYRREPPYTRDGDWLSFQSWLRTAYFPQRSNVVLNQFRANGLYPSVAAPSFNTSGGTVPEGFGLTMAGPAGSVYYTDDGSDPRLTGGAISPTAKVYTGMITVLEDKHIKARTRTGTTWSALNEGYFMVEIPPALRISEVMYQPVAPPAGSPYSADDFEYVELTNVRGEPFDLAGVRFTKGITFDFTGSDVTRLEPGQYVLVVKNRAAFASRYDTTGLAIAGEYGDTLSDSGEQVRLDDSLGNPIAQFTYSTLGAWPTRAAGAGSSLEVIDPTINPRVLQGDLNVASHWRASNDYGGSPGAPGTAPYSDVVINEVLAHAGASQRTAIELHNTTGAAIDISSWYLSDSSGNYQKFIVSPGTLLPANGYVTFDETQFHPSPGSGFALNPAHGGEVNLLAPATSIGPARFVDKITYPAMAVGESYGRYPNGAGDLGPMQTLTLGAANSNPRVGSIVFSGIMYRPPEATFGVENTLDEFVTLANITGSPVALWNWFDTNQNGRQDAGEVAPWKLDLGVFYSFSAGTVLPAFGSLVVVSFDPVAKPDTLAAFRTKYGLAAGVPVVGPWVDKLDNFGETIRLQKPDTPPADEPSFVPYLLVEQLKYDDAAPWPTLPNGTGPSLVRRTPTAYGNDPANWVPSYFLVDNKDAGFTTVGTWPESGAMDEIANSSVYTTASGTSATWTPGFSSAGRYQVYVWWSRMMSNGTPYDRDPSATYTITHAGGATTLTFDQNVNYGQWVDLGTYDFPAGTSGNVRLSRGTTATAVQSTSADAVKFVGIHRMTPRASGSVVNDGAAQRASINSLAIQFLGDVSASLGSGDLTLRNDTTGGAVDLSSITPAYDPATSTATWNFAGVAIEDGYYTATLSGAGVTDAAGNPLADGNYTVRFFRLGGDADGSGAVDIFDVAALQPNYGQTSGMTPAQGDFDGDGDCDIFDVALLQTSYGKTLSLPGPASMPAADSANIPPIPALAPSADSDLASLASLVSRVQFVVPCFSGRSKDARPAGDEHIELADLGVAGGDRSLLADTSSSKAVRAHWRSLRFPRRIAAHSALALAVDQVIESRQPTEAKWGELVDAVAIAIHGQAISRV